MINQKPKHLLILKIVGFTLLIAGIVLTILGVTAFRWEHSPNPIFFAPGLIIIGPAIFMIILGFSSKILNLQVKTIRQFQDESKDDLKAIADNSADIYGESITKAVKAVKKGVNDYVFCKHCGSEIDADSTYCKKCGKQQ